MTEEMTDQEKMEFVFRVHGEEPDIEQWDRTVATELAKQEAIELTDEVWSVVSFLRRYFDEFGGIEYSRDLSALLDQKYHSQGGLKYLFTLFPKGPVSQGCRIAGIPLPKDSKNLSFGSVA